MMKSTLDIAKEFVNKLKSMESEGQGCGYPYWYLYRTEFMALDYILSSYEKLLKDYNKLLYEK